MYIKIEKTSNKLNEETIRAVQTNLLNANLNPRLDCLVGAYRTREWLDAFCSYIANSALAPKE